jgi:hypothetical protein
MNVFILTVVLDGRQIEVDDVHDVANIEATSGNTGSDHDGGFTSLEGTTANSQQDSWGKPCSTYRASSRSR